MNDKELIEKLSFDSVMLGEIISVVYDAKLDACTAMNKIDKIIKERES